MDDFGMLTKDFGFRPSGKSAPMKSTGVDRPNKPVSNDIFNDVVYSSSPKFANTNSKSTPSISDYDSLFKDSNNNYNEAKCKPKSNSNMNSNSPLYDDDIFEGLAGLKNKPVFSGSVRYDDNLFASMTTSPPQQSKQSLQSDQFDDLLGSLGRAEKAESIGHSNSDKSSRGLDDLIPGFGSGSPASINRQNSDQSPTSTGKINKKSNALDDPFVVLESFSTTVASSKGEFTDPLEEISEIGKSRSTKSGVSLPSEDVFGDIDSLDGFNKSPPAYVKKTNNRKNGRTPSEEGSRVGSARSSVSREPLEESSFGYFDSQLQKISSNDLHESHQTVHDVPSVSRNTRRSFDQTTSPSSHTESMSSKSEERVSYVWLTVSEIPLFTPVTKASPPSRPSPPIPTRAQNSEGVSISGKYSQNTNAFRNEGPVQVDRDELALDEESEEEEKEKRRVEKKKMREIDREKARQAVDRANREARGRAASRLKAERAAVQRAQTEARERAADEARERAERVAAERAAKEKAEKEAHEKAQKEAQEKVAIATAQAEARRRAERAAVERVTAEARERAAAEARERVATAAAADAAKMNQQKNDDDLDSFFGTGLRPSSVPKARTTSNDSATDPLSQDKRRPEGGHSVRKASSTTNFVDDLSSIFAAATPAGEFKDVEGETEERRRARLERQQRTQERVAKALAEKNQRDQQILKDQEEKQRISTTLDVEIKRWAAGKEGNLRAMLSTLQFVLWSECGWQPISLTNLITGANVKKAYRKATLCIHPDKVQQKGANLQQKYVAEKVFDLLKEAWNKFNSEELF